MPSQKFDLSQFQKEQAEWASHNFRERKWEHPFMGVVEKVGELSHSLLKQIQGIRGTSEERQLPPAKAEGDLNVK